MNSVELNLRKEEIQWLELKADRMGVSLDVYTHYLFRGAMWREKERDEQVRGE